MGFLLQHAIHLFEKIFVQMRGSSSKSISSSSQTTTSCRIIGYASIHFCWQDNIYTSSGLLWCIAGLSRARQCPVKWLIFHPITPRSCILRDRSKWRQMEGFTQNFVCTVLGVVSKSYCKVKEYIRICACSSPKLRLHLSLVTSFRRSDCNYNGRYRL